VNEAYCVTSFLHDTMFCHGGQAKIRIKENSVFRVVTTCDLVEMLSMVEGDTRFTRIVD
jgi:hypothetical protein